jgi:hypothetical protein
MTIYERAREERAEQNWWIRGEELGNESRFFPSTY